jgi:TctA family transporter
VLNSGVTAVPWWRTITLRRLALIFGETLAWAWAIVAGGGGFGLILTDGPLPLTHGWYALFSGLAWCPAMAWLLKRYANVEASYWTRFAVAALIILAGRIALVVKIWPFG